MFRGTDQSGWRRSSFCSNGACVEIAHEEEVVLVRNSQAPERVMEISESEWAAFINAVRTGEFTPPSTPSE